MSDFHAHSQRLAINQHRVFSDAHHPFEHIALLPLRFPEELEHGPQPVIAGPRDVLSAELHSGHRFVRRTRPCELLGQRNAAAVCQGLAIDAERNAQV